MRKQTYALEELRETLVHDRLDDLPVDISEPYTHQSTRHQQSGEKVHVPGLTTLH